METRIGDYVLAGRLGSGGQGVVYDAYDPEGRRVAVKVLHTGAAATDSPRRPPRPGAWPRTARPRSWPPT
ncbi:hypothetical protein [Nonomuraea recticatena]|uniref:hypothetical protein n=1 Tax=Nonomuraea recticatena TaxID=46178 RepID=UPI00361A2CEA